MAYSEQEKENIKFDYESGRYSVRKVAKKWSMSTQTLKKFSDEGGWKLGCRNEEINKLVEERAADILVARDAQKLVEYVEEHLEVIGLVDDMYKVLLTYHINEMKESEGMVSKADGEKWTANYKALQIGMDFVDKSFRSKRLAMGLKETDAPKMEMHFNMTKVSNVSGLSDEQLDYIIAHEGDVDSTTIN